MPITRQFLGWDAPLLNRAVDWLLAQDASPHTLNLDNVLVVVPARRAGRRLLELLAQASAGRALTPPKIVTPSSLPEHLYEGPVPAPDVDWGTGDPADPDADGFDAAPAEPVAQDSGTSPGVNDVASPLVSLLARVHALRSMPAADLQAVIPTPPEADDFSSWLSLASDFAKLEDDLAAYGLEVFDVPQTLQKRGRPLDERQIARWGTIGSMQRQYERALARHGLLSLAGARRRAIEKNACRCERRIVLVAASDLSPLQTQMLRAVADAGTPITALIHAPESESDSFDALGRFFAHVWAARQVELGQVPLKIVDRPRDQAQEVVRTLTRRTHEARHALSPDDVTIGLGDEALAPLIERTLELSGTAARFAAGKQVARSRPVMLLQAWATFVHSRKLSDLASLIRHPDAEAFLNEKHRARPQANPGPAPREATPHWPTLLDRYITDHLHGSTPPQFLHSKESDALVFASEEFLGLAQDQAAETLTLAAWSPLLAHAMTSFYEHASLSTTDPSQSEFVRSLRTLGDVLRQFTAIPDQLRFSPRISLKQAVSLMVSQLSMTLPPVTLKPAVELLGWLELSLDDAHTLIVTGLNEGQIPQSVNADPLLPDSIRTGLGVLDNTHRYARDLLALTTILRSNRDVTLIAGRRSAEGDPLAPSRLLLACPTAQLIARLGLFFGESHAAPPARPLIGGKAAEQSGFVIPLPIPIQEPITSLHVTAFGDYIKCPYRFYLKHVRKLSGLDDHAIELDARAYGSLVHGVLQDFAASDLAASSDAKRIADFFIDHLRGQAREKFGTRHQPAVMLQLEQLENRLRMLARWQADQTDQGWRIVPDMTEKRLEDSIDLGECMFKIEGRIDRVDAHEKHGYRIIDYKTSDKKEPDDPEKSHRVGTKSDRRWVNLQLPLYNAMVRKKVGGTRAISLAFVNLPTNPGANPCVLAPWSESELQEAYQRAADVARCVYRGVFWPPAKPPDYSDEFAEVCQDQSQDRAAVIAMQQRILDNRKGATP